MWENTFYLKAEMHTASLWAKRDVSVLPALSACGFDSCCCSISYAASRLVFRSLTVVLALLDCRTVPAGAFYDSIIPWKGFHTGTVKSQVQMQPNTAEYLFAATDPKGALCVSSWNKLYGGATLIC